MPWFKPRRTTNAGVGDLLRPKVTLEGIEGPSGMAVGWEEVEMVTYKQGGWNASSGEWVEPVTTIHGPIEFVSLIAPHIPDEMVGYLQMGARQNIGEETVVWRRSPADQGAGDA